MGSPLRAVRTIAHYSRAWLLPCHICARTGLACRLSVRHDSALQVASLRAMNGREGGRDCCALRPPPRTSMRLIARAAEPRAAPGIRGLPRAGAVCTRASGTRPPVSARASVRARLLGVLPIGGIRSFLNRALSSHAPVWGRSPSEHLPPAAHYRFLPRLVRAAASGSGGAYRSRSCGRLRSPPLWYVMAAAATQGLSYGTAGRERPVTGS